MLRVYRVSTATGYVCLMYLQIQMPQNGTKKIFSKKQTTRKVPLLVLDVKVLKQR